MPHGCLPQPKLHVYVIVIGYFMVFGTMFHPLCLHYKHWAYKTTWFRLQTVDILNHAPAFSCHCNILPEKDTMIPYMVQIRHPLNNQIFKIFDPFVTTLAMLHYPEFADKHSP